MAALKSLIVNLPYEQPTRHWEQGRDGTLLMREWRRSAGYEVFDTRNNTRRSEPLDLRDVLARHT